MKDKYIETLRAIVENNGDCFKEHIDCNECAFSFSTTDCMKFADLADEEFLIVCKNFLTLCDI